MYVRVHTLVVVWLGFMPTLGVGLWVPIKLVFRVVAVVVIRGGENFWSLTGDPRVGEAFTEDSSTS